MKRSARSSPEKRRPDLAGNVSRLLQMISWPEIALALALSALTPLYRIAYFRDYSIIWEGAYRISLGQVPYRDFGIPVGVGAFLLPALAMKLFGASFGTLVFVQAFLNFTTLLVFGLFLRFFVSSLFCRLLSILVLGLAYTSCMVLPWYNTSGFLFELLSFFFLIGHLLQDPPRRYIRLAGAAFFATLALMTKQDYGGIALLSSFSLLLFDAIRARRFRELLIWSGMVIGSAAVFILPFAGHDFFYWFNYGQSPHHRAPGRPSLLDWWLNHSFWQNLYIFLIAGSLVYARRLNRKLFSQPDFLFLALTCIVVGQSILISVTSGLAFTTGYFHGFAYAWLLYVLVSHRKSSVATQALITCAVLLCWYPAFSQISSFLQRPRLIISNWAPSLSETEHPEERALASDTRLIRSSRDLEAFGDLYLPEDTVMGIARLKQIITSSHASNLRVLNMTELTPLAKEMGFSPEVPSPLWFDARYVLFPREVASLCDRISARAFDIILFQDTHWPMPNEIRQCLASSYRLFEQFPGLWRQAPIYVFGRPKPPSG